jgi:hypothetical protein
MLGIKQFEHFADDEFFPFLVIDGRTLGDNFAKQSPDQDGSNSKNNAHLISFCFRHLL